MNFFSFFLFCFGRIVNNKFLGLSFVINMQGGWETDESKTEAALRETEEEAGVLGIIEVNEFNQLIAQGNWKEIFG